MLIYRVIPSLKKEYLYSYNPVLGKRASLLPDGYRGYQVGHLLNSLLNYDFKSFIREANKNENAGEATTYGMDYPPISNHVLSAAMLEIDALRASCFVDLIDRREVFKHGRWDVWELANRFDHVIYNYEGFTELPDSLKTEGLRRWVFEKIRPLKPYEFIDSALSPERKIWQAIIVAYYAFQEGLCTIIEENQKELGIVPSEMEQLRFVSFRAIEQVAMSRAGLSNVVKAFSREAEKVLERRAPKIGEINSLFPLLASLIECYSAVTSSSNEDDEASHMLDKIEEDHSYDKFVETLLKIQEKLGYEVADVFATAEFFGVMYQDTRLVRNAASESIRKLFQAGNAKPYSEILTRRTFELERERNQLVSVGLKAELPNSFFVVEDFLDLLMVLCYGACVSNVKPKRCNRCHKLYIPGPGKNASKYCSNMNDEYGLTCSEVALRMRERNGKRDYNERKHQALRKAQRGDKRGNRRAAEYYKLIADFIEKLGPYYRQSARISDETYGEWLNRVCAVDLRDIHDGWLTLPHFLIWDNRVIDDEALFMHQLDKAQEGRFAFGDASL